MTLVLESTNRGTGTEKAAIPGDPSFAFAPASTIPAGNYAVLVLVYDNRATTSGASDTVDVADTQGNTWETWAEATQTAGAALDGVTAAVLRSKLDIALTTADTITATFAGNVVAQGAGLFELSVDSGSVIDVEDFAANPTSSSGVISTSLSGLVSGPKFYLGVNAVEGESDPTVPMDSAYTQLFGGTIGSGTAGSTPTNVLANVGYLENTSTGDTFDFTVISAADRVVLLLALIETVVFVDFVTDQTLPMLNQAAVMDSGEPPVAINQTLPSPTQDAAVSVFDVSEWTDFLEVDTYAATNDAVIVQTLPMIGQFVTTLLPPSEAVIVQTLPMVTMETVIVDHPFPPRAEWKVRSEWLDEFTVEES